MNRIFYRNWTTNALSIVKANAALILSIGLKICVALSVAMFLAVVLNSLYSRPIYDDLWILEMANKQSSWGLVKTTYLNLTGRYAFIWSVATFMHFWGSRVQWFIFALLLLWAACGTWALVKRGQGVLAFGLASAIIVSCVTLAPQPLNSVYWFAAAANILPTLILLPLIMVVRRAPKAVGIITGAALGFLLAGFQEQAAMIAGCAILFFVARDWRSGRRSAPTLGVLVGFACGLFILLASPGNAVRAKGELEGGLHSLTLERAARAGFDGAQELVSNAVPHFGLYFPSLLDIPDPYFYWNGAPAFWVFALAALWGARTRPSERIEWKKVALLAFCGWALCSVMMTLSTMVTGQLPNVYPRIYFVPAFVVTVTFATMGFYARALIHKFPLVLCALVFLSLVGSWNAIHELALTSTSIRRFSHDWDAEDAKLKSLRKQGIRDVRMEPLMGPQAPIWTPDKTHWINRSVATYYGFNSIATTPTPTLNAKVR